MVTVGSGLAVDVGLAAVPLPSQAIEKSAPLVTADGVASVTPAAETMVSSVGLAAASAALLTIALVRFTVPKLDSGSTPLVSLGASAMISAEPSWAVADVWFVVCVQPRVWSLRVSVNAPPPFATTDALIVSPGATGLL